MYTASVNILNGKLQIDLSDNFAKQNQQFDLNFSFNSSG
ncbi:hypothetical protein BFV93_1953 [Alteromonas macleodii]|nr:hypothetical protein BFV93_1953 [Alteromonas macleodii]